MAEKTVGIVGGVGPFAGVDLQKKVLEQTVATRDQDHLTVVSLSQPSEIIDRTEFLLGQTIENPADAFVVQLLKLKQMGAQVAGIPCNTAHAPTIFGKIVAELEKADCGLKLLHMIEETAVHLHHYHPNIKHIGILSTTGTYLTQIYPEALTKFGLTAVIPNQTMQEEIIHPSIYDPHYGIKASGVATEKARESLETAVRALQAKGAEAIILGCTELPLAITEPALYDLPIIDPTLILARALIREANSAKLRQIQT